jgi:predicted metal-dependent phosphoesterase TrpH
MSVISDAVKDYKYKTELHTHTSPVSKCSHVTAAELVEMYAQLGVDAMVITNHYNQFSTFPEYGRCLSPEAFLKDYYDACKVGKEKGVNVILGIEVRFTENINDYLVYGVEPSDVEKFSAYFDKGIETFYRECKTSKNLILQAHPFRKEMVLAPLDSIDGIESINLHADHNGAIGLAAKYARDNNLIVSGGSDFHKPHHLAACLMRTKELPRDSYDIADILRSRDYFFDISGSFLFPYEY